MKISELAEASGESIPTIKFYIREGLLQPGDTTSRTRADYGEVHVKRLALIRTLQAELGMTVDTIGEVIRAAEQGGGAMLAAGLENARRARHGARKRKDEVVSPELGRAWKLITKMEKQLGWEIHPDDMMVDDVAEAVATILRVMPDARIEDSLVQYAQAMKAIADEEIPDSFNPEGDPVESMRYAVLGTYLFEPLILSLRRLAHGQRTAEIMKMRTKPSGGKSRG